MPEYNPEFQLVVPIAVTGGELHFILFAVWTCNKTDPDGRYIEQVWKAIRYYDKLLTGSTAVLIGDFNSNAIWNKEHRQWNHSHVVDALKEKGIVSTYHLHHNLEHGAETHHTHYLYRHEIRGFHIDYCFVSDDLIKKLESVEVGEYAFWKQFSDHVPLIVTFR